ncbi:MAG: hypothetical protein ABIJ40_20850 [Bacteroidota bacterium]
MMQITKKDGFFVVEGYSKSLMSPFFYPSISSIQANFDVHDYFELIRKTSYPAFLISAYDLHHHKTMKAFVEEVSELSKKSCFVLMDSGHYEAFWRRDDKWSFKQLQSVLNDIEVDLCFSFDIYFGEGANQKEHVDETIKYAAMTAGAQKSGLTIPIIHSSSKFFPSIVKKVVEGLSPDMIGITERELGSSLLERAQNLRKIRKELDKAYKDIPIHLLGTGNPASLLIYFLCGADFFDALEWCKTVADPKNGHLYHFVQMDLVDCKCKVCKLKGLSYPAKVMSHNLLFYENFTDEIRRAVRGNKVDALLKKYLPKHIISEVKKISLRK